MKGKHMWILGVLVLICFIFVLSKRKEFLEYKEKGMWQDYHGIYTTLPPADLELYRKLLPDVLDMPENPMVSMFVVDYVTVIPFPMSPYLEGSVAIKCKYKGEDGWHVLSMPVTKRVANIAGRLIGYPKYVADKIALEQTEQGTRGIVKFKGEVKLELEYTSKLSRSLSSDEKEAMEIGLKGAGEPRFLLVPPAKGPMLKRVIMKERIPANWEVEQGMVKIHIKPDDPWAGLVNDGTITAGQFKKFTGGSIMLNERVN